MLNYPALHSSIPAWMSAIFSIAVPLVVLLLSQFIVRSFIDLHHSFLGLALSLLFNLSFTGFIWITVGGHRPDFLQSCKPDLSKVVPGRIYYRPDDICTNKFYKSIMYTPGFPSGHASNAFAAWVFILLYLQAKMRLFDLKSHMWKLLLTWIPSLFMPIWITGSRLLDYTHSMDQVAAGACIGTVSAILAYRMEYCSVLGTDSHVPTRHLWTAKWEILSNEQDVM